MTQQDYEREIEFIFNRFPSYQKVGKIAYKPGIETMQELDSRMGHPHRNFRCIHVAGTNGKGSVSHMLAAALMQLPAEEAESLREAYPLQERSRDGFSGGGREQAAARLKGKDREKDKEKGDNRCGVAEPVRSRPEQAGGPEEREKGDTVGIPVKENTGNGPLKVGLYTSPHLLDFRERIRVNGEMVEKEFVYDFILKYKAKFLACGASFFEITTAMAFAYFARERVDFAVIECGLGGRLDSTNIIMPVLSVITNIGLDHCEYLGFTLPEIAREKAGIMKRGVPVVIGEEGGNDGHQCGGEKHWKERGSEEKTGDGEVNVNINVAVEVDGSKTMSVKDVFIKKARETESPLFFASVLEQRKGCGADKPETEFLSGPDGEIYAQALELSRLADRNEMDLQGACQEKNINTVSMAFCVAVLSKLPEKKDFHREKVISKSVCAGKGVVSNNRPGNERGDTGKTGRSGMLMNGWLESAARGFRQAARLTGLHGRWETLSSVPRIVCDTGHNAHGFKLLGPQIVEEARKYERLIMIFGVVADKDLDSIGCYLPDTYLNKKGESLKAFYYYVNASGSRALPAGVLEKKLKKYGFTGQAVTGAQNMSGDGTDIKKEVREGTVGAALDHYLGIQLPGDLVFIGGSTFVVAEALEYFEKNK